MELEEILEVVKKKYSKAIINDGYILIQPYLIQEKTLEIKPDEKKIYISYIGGGSDKNEEIENNIIELKHYLDIEITKEDIIEQFKYNKNLYFDKEYNTLNFSGIEKDDNYYYGLIKFYPDGTISDYEGNEIATKRSLWQVYNILKNLVE